MDRLNVAIKQLVDQLDTQLDKTRKTLRSLTDLKLQLQNVCKHTFEDDGEDHSHKYEKCTNCGFIQKKF